MKKNLLKENKYLYFVGLLPLNSLKWKLLEISTEEKLTQLTSIFGIDSDNLNIYSVLTLGVLCSLQSIDKIHMASGQI